MSSSSASSGLLWVCAVVCDRQPALCPAARTAVLGARPQAQHTWPGVSTSPVRQTVKSETSSTTPLLRRVGMPCFLSVCSSVCAIGRPCCSTGPAGGSEWRPAARGLSSPAAVRGKEHSPTAGSTARRRRGAHPLASQSPQWLVNLPWRSPSPQTHQISAAPVEGGNSRGRGGQVRRCCSRQRPCATAATRGRQAGGCAGRVDCSPLLAEAS